jgi:t-SNARE complex subunit (syntaxin)
LAEQLGSNLKDFQGVQRYALERQRQSATAARAAFDQDAESRQQGNQGFGAQGQQLLQQEQIRLASQDEVDYNEQRIIEREDAIRQIEDSMREINEISNDLNTIVVEQGYTVQTVAGNVERVHTDTRGAQGHLVQASRSQRNARNKMCILLVILSIILIVVVLAIVLP